MAWMLRLVMEHVGDPWRARIRAGLAGAVHLADLAPDEAIVARRHEMAG
jgi:hypothetical protein